MDLTQDITKSYNIAFNQPQLHDRPHSCLEKQFRVNLIQTQKYMSRSRNHLRRNHFSNSFKTKRTLTNQIIYNNCFSLLCQKRFSKETDNKSYRQRTTKTNKAVMNI